MTTIHKNKGLATVAARRAGIENPIFTQVDGGYIVRDGNSPLFDASKRSRSTVESPVAIVWDLVLELLPKGMTRKQIVELAVAKGVSVNTAKAQYQRAKTAMSA